MSGAATTRGVWADGLWCAALATLPWAGVGVIHLATGVDVGGGLQPAWILLAAALVLRAPEILQGLADRNRSVPASWPVMAAAIMAVVAVSGLGLVLVPADAPAGAMVARLAKQAVQLAIMMAFAGWAAVWTRGELRRRRTARWLTAGLAFQIVYAVLQYLHYHHPGGPLPWLEGVFTSNPAILAGSEELYVGDRFLPVPRLRGTMCEPLYLGNYLLLAVPMAAWTGYRRGVRVALAAAGVLLLVLTWSRGAWLGGLATAAILMLVGIRLSGSRPGRGAWIAAAAVAALVVAAAAAGGESLTLPFRRLMQSFSDSDWSNLTRLYGFQAAWRAFQLSPLVGVGWGQYGWHFSALVDPAGLHAMVTWPVVASYPLQILCETGVLGFGVLAAIARRHLVAGYRAWNRGRPADARALMLLAVLVGMTVQLMTFAQYNLPHIWVAWGLLLAAEREADGERSA